MRAETTEDAFRVYPYRRTWGLRLAVIAAGVFLVGATYQFLVGEPWFGWISILVAIAYTVTAIVLTQTSLKVDTAGIEICNGVKVLRATWPEIVEVRLDWSPSDGNPETLVVNRAGSEPVTAVQAVQGLASFDHRAERTALEHALTRNADRYRGVVRMRPPRWQREQRAATT